MTGERPKADLLKLLYATDLSEGLANELLKSAEQILILLKGRIKIHSASPIYQTQSPVNKLELISRSAEYHTRVRRKGDELGSKGRGGLLWAAVLQHVGTGAISGIHIYIYTHTPPNQKSINKNDVVGRKR